MLNMQLGEEEGAERST